MHKFCLGKTCWIIPHIFFILMWWKYLSVVITELRLLQYDADKSEFNYLVEIVKKIWHFKVFRQNHYLMMQVNFLNLIPRCDSVNWVLKLIILLILCITLWNICFHYFIYENVWPLGQYSNEVIDDLVILSHVHINVGRKHRLSNETDLPSQYVGCSMTGDSRISFHVNDVVELSCRQMTREL